MCITPKASTPAANPIAAYDNTEANRQADVEARLRQRRRGAAANILTSARGIPSSTNQLGKVA